MSAFSMIARCFEAQWRGLSTWEKERADLTFEAGGIIGPRPLERSVWWVHGVGPVLSVKYDSPMQDR